MNRHSSYSQCLNGPWVEIAQALTGATRSRSQLYQGGVGGGELSKAHIKREQ